MADESAKPISPISHLLQKIGLTRDDLSRHSDQMRQFLTTEDAKSLRVFSAESADARQSIASLEKSRACSQSSSNSRQNASAPPQSPPPSTPVKSEPVEPTMSLRHMDSMEMILEQKSRRAKRDKRGKEKERTAPSPSPVSAAFSLDAFMQSRDLRRVPSLGHSDSFSSIASLDNHEYQLPPPPVTPQHRKYYRDYDTIEQPSRVKKGSYTPQDQSPTPTRHRSSSIFDESRTNAADTSNSTFITPRRNGYYKSPLPSSSPPQSSPFATPSNKRIVNLVSSPGPMGPLPDEDDYDSLPYSLPSGPFSMKKPDLSYAALIGQAILSSTDHRLTLQEIYDWITIVYPYYNRSETTWMNSIRHVLSTTICFRKVPRDRSVGRTLWAIWDCDLECFTDGGFRKEHCAEIKEASKKAAPKKRAAEELASGRKTKRQKRGAAHAAVELLTSSPVQETPAVGESAMPTLVPYSQLFPLFPPRASTHHQPYYQNCVQLPAEVIFPPLPPSSGYARASISSLPPSSAAKSSDEAQTSPTRPSSLPALTPNNSSSSPRLTSEDYVFLNADRRMSPGIESTPPLECGITLLDTDKAEKGKAKASLPPPKTPPKKSIGLPPVPISPTFGRRGKAKKVKQPAQDCLPPVLPTTSTLQRPATPPRPSTPPRKGSSSIMQLSPIRTPLSHRGLHMSPSASLAHYKLNLDPPPSVTFHPDDGINPAVFDIENIRTPSRKRGPLAHGHHHKDTSTLFPPVTPKKLVFPTQPSSAESPFRTPGSKSIFDPHDPGALLDEELARLGAKGMQESPIGLFEGRRGLLYQSPNMPSPGKWSRWF